MYIKGWSHVKLLQSLSDDLDVSSIQLMTTYVKRRMNAEPIAYIIGQTSFLEQTFLVDSGVFIPRPETELLVKKVMEHCEKTWGKNEDVIFLELGCGTGVIGLSLARYFKNSRVVMWDKSDLAINNTMKNQHNDTNVKIKHGDFFDDQDEIDHLFSLGCPVYVVTNPPYIPTVDIDTLDKDVRDYEPRLALDGGDDGGDIYRKIMMTLKQYCYTCFCEIGINQSHFLEKDVLMLGGQNISFFLDDNTIPRIMMFDYE